MKKVSVIVPVYKVEKYISDTISSVLKQTYRNFEMIVVDDGSPDRSIEICQQFTDSRIKIIRQVNRGLAAARNAGIRQAEGEYLAFLDGDDRWLPEKLEKHIQHLENSPTVGVSFSRSAFIDEAGNSLNVYQMPKLKEITPADLFRSNSIGNGSAAMVRAEVFESIKFQQNLHEPREDCYFDEQFRRSEDIECWLRIAIQTNWQIEGIPEALTLYRVNSTGLSANLLAQLESSEKVIEKVGSYAPELMKKWEKTARAYQLLYLARTAVRLQAGKLAVELMHRALITYWHIVLEKPRSTLLTLAAAYLLWLLPQTLYRQIESLTLKTLGSVQKRPILQEQSKQLA